MKKYLILALLVAVFHACESQKKKEIKPIDIEIIKSDVIGKEVQLVDVRTEQEYIAGHIDDAINIDVKEEATFIQKISELDKTKPVYIYCQMGGRSAKASKKLLEMGFETVYDYSGGYGEWNQKQ